MKVAHFQRSKIGHELVEKLGDWLLCGESLVLLGPHKIGKRYVLRVLRKRLAQEGRTRVGRVSYLKGLAHHEADEGAGSDGAAWVSGEPGEALRWVDEQFAHGEGIVTLLASNVDQQPRERLRELLGGIRQRLEGWGVPEGCRLAVVLTGEINLGLILDPAVSEFVCENQYVLSGFDPQTFGQITSHYLRAIGGGCVRMPDDETIKELYLRTGGNAYYLRMILWSLFERHAGSSEEKVRRLSVNEDSDREVAENIRWNARLRYVHGSLENDPDLWGELERLIKNGSVTYRSNKPHPFELAGVAVREGDRLEPPGSLCRTFLRNYYSDRRFADYYARQSDWEEAFHRYRSIPRGERIRPLTADDVVETVDLVKTLRTSLYRKALKRPDGVLSRFADGCRDLLGFGEVTLWHRDDDEDWHPVCRDGGCFDKPDAEEARYLQVLEREHSRSEEMGRLELTPEFDQSVVAIRLPSTSPGLREVVVVGRPGDPTILSNARRNVTRDLVNDMFEAYQHALDAEKVRGLLKTREVYTEIISEIVSKLGDQVIDVRQGLEMAADRLHETYRRVIFSLVAPDGRRIEAVVERSHDSSKMASERTSYPLDTEEQSGHVWVVRNKKSIVADAKHDPRCAPDIVRDADVRGIAIVPMKTPDGKVLGTLSVETIDRRIPTEDEVEVVEEFARQLAAVLLSVKRVEFLFKALDSSTDPIAFFDRSDGQRRLRYANKAAEADLGHRGWIPADRAPTFEELSKKPKCASLANLFGPLIARAFETRKLQEVTAPLQLQRPRGPRSYHVEAVAIPFDDYHAEFDRFRDQTAGVLCHVRLVDDLYRMYKVLKSVVSAADREEFVRRVVWGVQELGYTHGQLFMARDDGTLVHVENLPGGSGPLPIAGSPPTAPASDMPSIQEGRSASHEILSPVLFKFDPDASEGAGRETREGVPYIVSHASGCDGLPCREKGAFWIEFPLRVGSRVDGKLYLDCAPSARLRADEEAPEATHPRDFEFLRVFCELTGALLHGLKVQEDDFRAKIQERIQMAHAAVHDIKTRLVPLALVQLEYDTLAERFDDASLREANQMLCKIRKDFRRCYEEILDRKFDDKKLELERVDIEKVLNEDARCPHVLCVINVSGVIELDLDRVQFRRAIRELIQNSYDHAYTGREGTPVRECRLTFDVGVFIHEDEPWVRLTVSDNGRGVKSAMKQAIFSPYMSTVGGQGIRGLGLPMVKGIIERHRGTIREDGDYPNGARFVIELPQTCSRP
jgi:signal transduction histidine kinase